MFFPASASFFKFMPPNSGTPMTESANISVRKKMIID